MKKTLSVFSAGPTGVAPSPAGGRWGWGYGAGQGHAGSFAISLRHASTLALALALCAALAGCSSQPPVPDWQINAHSAAQRAVQSYLSGQTRSAEREFDQARDQTARTGSPALMARLELLRCAAQVGSTVVQPCVRFDTLRKDAAEPELAYDRYLQGQVQSADVALLPLAQQGVAAVLLAGGEVDAAVAGGSRARQGARPALAAGGGRCAAACGSGQPGCGRHSAGSGLAPGLAPALDGVAGAAGGARRGSRRCRRSRPPAPAHGPCRTWGQGAMSGAAVVRHLRACAGQSKRPAGSHCSRWCGACAIPSAALVAMSGQSRVTVATTARTAVTTNAANAFEVAKTRRGWGWRRRDMADSPVNAPGQDGSGLLVFHYSAHALLLLSDKFALQSSVTFVACFSAFPKFPKPFKGRA